MGAVVVDLGKDDGMGGGGEGVELFHNLLHCATLVHRDHQLRDNVLVAVGGYGRVVGCGCGRVVICSCGSVVGCGWRFMVVCGIAVEAVCGCGSVVVGGGFNVIEIFSTFLHTDVESFKVLRIPRHIMNHCCEVWRI